MSKKKNSYDDLLNGASFDDIRKLLFSHARTGVTTNEYPYVKGHATLQVDEIEPRAYHLYISLINSPVKIFRRITVPSNLRLEHLAEIIIRVMGWTNEHLHQFIVKGTNFVSPKELEEGGSLFSNPDAMACVVSDVLQNKGDTIKFEYDFCDSWMHSVRLSSIDDFDIHHQISVDSGTGSCPPEDVGGVYGYADMLEDGSASAGKFDIERARLAVGNYVSSVIANAKATEGPVRKPTKKQESVAKKKAKVVRMIPYTFSVSDIKRMHPKGLKASPTDKEYALLANRIERVLASDAYSDFMGADYMKAILSRVIMYYEDIIADAGMWRGFINKNLELYNRPLPFYHIEGEYYPDEPHVEDVQLLIWDAMRDVRGPSSISNPENPGIEQAAKLIYKILDEEFENVGINENLADYFKIAEFANDYYELRDVLEWIFTDCYLTSDDNTQYIINEKKYELLEFIPANKINGAAKYTAPITSQVGMLALLPKDWLSLFIAAKGNKSTAKKVASLKPEDTAGLVVNYAGKKYINGDSELSKAAKIPKDIEIIEEEIGTTIDEEHYKQLMEESGGSPLFYFKNITQCKKFLKEKCGWNSKSLTQLKQFSGAKNITLFIQSTNHAIATIPDLADGICDKRNPYYNKKTAEKTALSILFDPDSMPGVAVRYLIQHNMIPDAAINSLKGSDYGRQLVQDNIDFLARSFRRECY